MAGLTRKTIVIGAGNGFRTDDGAGLVAVERLRARVPDGVPVLAVNGQATELMTAWQDCHTVIIIDAVSSGGAGGHIHRFEPIEAPLPTELFRFSTHAFGVVEAIELGRALGTLPPRIIVYGVEGANFDSGTELTEPVAAAVDTVVERVVQDIEGAHHA